MSSLFTKVEEALADLGLAAAADSFPEGEKLDVVVGGLGLGYTAQAALACGQMGSLRVVDYLEAVIEWHEAGLVPLGRDICADERTRLVHGDFFKLALAVPPEASFDPEGKTEKFHAVLLDIDHSPANLLHQRHADFYRAEGLRRLAERLHPGGVFALWSDDPPEESFLAALAEVFASCESHVVAFDHPMQDRECRSTVYVARRE